MTLIAAMILAVSAQAQVMMLSEAHAMKRVNTNQRYLLLPVQEKEEIAHVKVICQNQVVKELNVRLAVDHVDYLVPLDLQDPAFNTNQQRPSTLLLLLAAHGDQRYFRHAERRALPPGLSSYTAVGMDERPQRHVL